jgi:dTDP-4-dehydrorhamnose reductase
MRIAVLGARGQLGSALIHDFRSAYDVTPFDHSSLDITDPTAVAEQLGAVRPAVIVNCAAYNLVDKAEDDPVSALQANAFGVRSLARAAQTCNATLVHFSTDFVFDGTATAPYSEQDRPNPRSVYATSKMLGEWFAEDAPRSYVLRVESLFGRPIDGAAEKGSVATIVRALRSGTPARVFEDRTVSPTHVPDAVRATRALIENGAPSGLYHCVNSGHCTWLEFAQEVARQLGVQPRFEIIRQSDLNLAAERPRYCALSNQKLAAAGIAMPTWQDALARYLQ